MIAGEPMVRMRPDKHTESWWISWLRRVVGRFTFRYLIGLLLSARFEERKLPTRTVRARTVGRASHDLAELAARIDQQFLAVQRRICDDFAVRAAGISATVLLVDSSPGIRAVAEDLWLVGEDDPQSLYSVAHFAEERLLLVQLSLSIDDWRGDLTYGLVRAMLFRVFGLPDGFRWSAHGYASSTAWDLSWHRSDQLIQTLDQVILALAVEHSDCLRDVIAGAEGCRREKSQLVTSLCFCLVQFLQDRRQMHPAGWQVLRDSLAGALSDAECIPAIEQAFGADFDSFRAMLIAWCRRRRLELEPGRPGS